MEIDLKDTAPRYRNSKKAKPSERIRASVLDKLMYFSNPYSDGQCRCVIRFEGQVDGSKLARAVELSLKVAPIIGCRFVYHPWQCFWEKGPISAIRMPFRYLETEDAEKETSKFLNEPMDTLQGIQVAVCLIRSGNDTLVIKLSHMVADAMGLLDYMGILGRLYSELMCNPEYIPPETPKFKRGLGQVLRNVGITALTKGLCNWCYPKSHWGFPQLNPDYSGVAFPVRLIGKERLNIIKTLCHEKGIKFTDVITAAFYQALFDILKPQPDSLLPIQMTMDLRRYLPSGKMETICNLIGAYYPVIRYTSGKSFDQTLLEVQRVIAAKRKGESWFGAVVFMELLNLFPGFCHKLLARKVVKHEFSSGTSRPNLSNLGVIDPCMKDFGDLKINDLGLFGPVCYPPNFMITIYTFREQLYINSSFCPTAADPKLVDRFFDSFLNYMPAKENKK